MPWWALPLLVLGALGLGVLPWLTTSWRVTPTQFQKRSGVLSRTTSTAPLDRVRSVDLEASLLHRVLGLSKVQIGTGVDDDRITLDAVSRDRAAELRAHLLARRQGVVPVTTAGPVDGTAAEAPAPVPETRSPRSTGPGCASRPSAWRGWSCWPAWSGCSGSSPTTCPSSTRST